MPTIDIAAIEGRSYLLPHEEDGERHRATILKVYDEHMKGLINHGDRIKVKVRIGDDEFDKLIAYNEMLEVIEDEHGRDGTWNFRSILQHQGPIQKSDKERYKGSLYNVLVHWETGEKTWEPIKTMSIGPSKAELADYAREHGLLDTEAWAA